MFRYALPTDTNSGGGGVIRNLPAWNLDMTVTKDLTFRERFGMMFIFQSPNVLNHVVLGAPNFALGSPTTFGVITSSAASYSPRQMRFGLRVHFELLQRVLKDSLTRGGRVSSAFHPVF